MDLKGLYKAIKYFGSQTEMAKVMGIRQQTISNWINRGVCIPYPQVLKIASATKGYVTHNELAPDEKELNQILDDIIYYRSQKFIEIHIDRIKLNHRACQHEKICVESIGNLQKERLVQTPLTVNINFELIGCDCQIEMYKQLGKTCVLIKIVK